jgi:DNA-binding transcriptional MerR regulator
VSGVRAYRRFNIEQVETIRKIKDYLDEGFTLAAAAQKATGMNISTKGGQQHA